MKNAIKKSLFDVKASIEAIYLHLKGSRNFFEYKENLTVKRAVERELEIIGEAINRILKEKPDFELVNARRIVNLRNFIIHAYDSIDDETIWAIINRHIPELEEDIKKLLTI